mmetsp:Transcript_48954/g.138265  ORF Transcript_48954/g.138265 Transcript_48954/m.138265 type:complete len:238 (+) Transcript_48954:826-1539(+)
MLTDMHFHRWLLLTLTYLEHAHVKPSKGRWSPGLRALTGGIQQRGEAICAHRADAARCDAEPRKGHCARLHERVGQQLQPAVAHARAAKAECLEATLTLTEKRPNTRACLKSDPIPVEIEVFESTGVSRCFEAIKHARHAIVEQALRGAEAGDRNARVSLIGVLCAAMALLDLLTAVYEVEHGECRVGRQQVPQDRPCHRSERVALQPQLEYLIIVHQDLGWWGRSLKGCSAEIRFG